ncbi:MAG TPA: L-threonylcarbamoyladenylate synthase [Blastocatellia bacterium]|jgi:L-threonylcarbamoyladenylate synthase
MTRVIQVDAGNPQQEIIEQAAAIIRSGGLVAFPTETVYGLGADAMNEAAIRKIFEAKGRPGDNPLIVHVCDRNDVERVATEVSAKAWQLIERFWPGPLTLVLRRRTEVARSVSAGLSTVAVRMPHNEIALELIRRARAPIAAPSANSSGRPSPTTARHVARDLGGRIDMILDGGATKIGIESTVLDMTAETAVILRPGWITEESLAAITGPIERASSREELRRSPGTRYRHYSPRARVVLVEQSSSQSIERLMKEHLRNGPVGLIGHTPLDVNDAKLYQIRLENSARDYARSIYAALRELDEKKPCVILVEAISEEGEGAAVMDRLRRAASEEVNRHRRANASTQETELE